MRKRYAAALIASVALAGAGGLAFADPFASGDPGAATATAATTTVTLPAGDQVQLTPDGRIAPVAGQRLRMFTTALANGDRLTIPVKRLKDVRAGRTDPRLYDVDALLRHGYTDARKVNSPKELGAPVGDDSASAKAADTKVTVNYTWVDGSKKAELAGTWINLDTGKVDFFDGGNGTGSVSLPPGHYGFVLSLMDENGDAAGTEADLTVTDKPATITMDGKRAKPLGFKVDAAGSTTTSSNVTFFRHGAKDDGIYSAVGADGDTKTYAIPFKLPKDTEAGYTLDTQMATPSGAAKPTTYSLYDAESKGVPSKPIVTVHDRNLAKREVTYDGQGAKATMWRQNMADSSIAPEVFYLASADAALPSKRTEFFSTAGVDGWLQLAQTADEQGKHMDTAYRSSGALKPGDNGKTTWLAAPVQTGVQDDSLANGLSMTRTPKGSGGANKLEVDPQLFAGSAADETFLSNGTTGKAELSKDGKVIATSKDPAGVGITLPQGDKGRYTASFDSTRDMAWTKLGTHSTAKWAFDSAPVSKNTRLDLSSVRLNASGLSNGYADASKAQKVTLDFVTAAGAADRECKAMTFQVSYDDGKTWKKVALKRKGDHATATLKHPSGARFVSVKFSTKDDKGQTFTGTTIRSYGLT